MRFQLLQVQSANEQPSDGLVVLVPAPTESYRMYNTIIAQNFQVVDG